jgi:hypothetical protein
MAEIIDTPVRRDTALEQRMLEAVIADRNDQPRNKQLQVGPSEVGGCRELLRAGLFESDTLAEPETYWATAAHVGTVMGADLEDVFGRRLDALEQQRITAHFATLGVNISGAIDLLFLAEGYVADLKSTDDVGGVLYDLKKNASIIETLLTLFREGSLFGKIVETPDGGYELTDVLIQKMSKLHYYVQVSIYVMGAIQQGILEVGAEGRLVFYDRSGSYQEFVALTITADEIELFYEIGQRRIEQVVNAQIAFEQTGQPAVLSGLRDMTPSFCFSPKVQCPRRLHCWQGSDWANDNRIESPMHVAAVDRYEIGRDMEKLGAGMKKAAREELRDVQGVLPDGRMVTWVRGGSQINVVASTREKPKAMGTVLDDALAVMTSAPPSLAAVEAPAETEYGPREKQLEKMKVGELRNILSSDYDLETKGLKAELVTRILGHEFPQPTQVGGPHLDAPMDAMDDTSGYETAQPEPTLSPEEEQAWIDQTAQGLGERMAERDEAYEMAQQTVDAQVEQCNAPQPYDETAVLRRRQEIFGLPFIDLQSLASWHDIDPEQPKGALIQLILDAEFERPEIPAAPDPRTQRVRFEPSGDETTDRLREMQYNADPAMRRNYEEES